MKPLDRQPPLMRALEDPPSHSRLFAQVPFDLINDHSQPAGVLAVYAHLDALAVEHGKGSWSTSINEIGRALEMPKTTTLRAVTWLVERDYLRRTASQYRYQTAFVLVHRLHDLSVPVRTDRSQSVPVRTTIGPREDRLRNRTSSYREIDQRDTDQINARARAKAWLQPDQVEERIASWKG